MLRRSFLTAVAAMPLAGRALAGTDSIRVRDLYEKDGSFSDLARSLEGERVTFEGYMAPPLKANAKFFVLTNRPMAVCPFCETEAEWPQDILAIYTKRPVDPVYYTVNIDATGLLELGSFRDEETGFLSRVRLADATYD